LDRVLDPKPLPTRLRVPPTSDLELAQHRRFGCERYATCLDASVKEKWESFSCQGCPFAAASADRSREVSAYAQARFSDGLGF
jgi:hypothetical protein